MPKIRIKRRRKTWGASKKLMAKRAKLRAAYRKRKRSGPGAASSNAKTMAVFRTPKGLARNAPLKMQYNAMLIIQPSWGTTAIPAQHMSGFYIDASSCNPKAFQKFGHEDSYAVDGIFQQIFPKTSDTPNQSTMRGMEHISKLYAGAYVDSSTIEWRIRIAPGFRPFHHTPTSTQAFSFFNDFIYGTLNTEDDVKAGTTPADLRAMPTLKRIRYTTPSMGDQRQITLKAAYNPRKRLGVAHPSDVQNLQFGTTVAENGARQPQCNASAQTYFFLGYLPSHGLDVWPYDLESAKQFPKFFVDYRIKYNVMYGQNKSDIARADLPAFWWQSRWKAAQPYRRPYTGAGHDEL